MDNSLMTKQYKCPKCKSLRDQNEKFCGNCGLAFENTKQKREALLVSILIIIMELMAYVILFLDAGLFFISLIILAFKWLLVICNKVYHPYNKLVNILLWVNIIIAIITIIIVSILYILLRNFMNFVLSGCFFFIG